MAKNIEYKMDKAGIMAIAKSPGTLAQLEKLAATKAAEANKLLAAHGGDTSHGYMSHGHVGNRSSFANIHTAGITTELDQRTYHTLNAINH